MKRLFKANQIDLLDDNNYTLMLQICNQEKDFEGKKQAENRRIE